MTSRVILFAGAAAAGLLAWAPGVLAADAAADSASSTVGPVIVTARRVAEDVQKIPVAVTAVTPQGLKDANIQDLDDLTKAAPGLQVSLTPDNPSGASISIRGQNATDDAITVDPTVGVYYDGVYLPRSNGLQFILRDVDEIGQVEVLRGPQGTLFGRNTTGGAINITSAAPGPDLGAYVRVQGGDYAYVDVTAGLNAPFGDASGGGDFGGLRLSYEHSQHDGYGTDSLGAGLESENYDFFHGRFSAKVGDAFSLDVSANYLRLNAGEPLDKLYNFNPASLFNPATAQEAEGVVAEVLVESGLQPTPANFPLGVGILESFTGGSLYRTGGSSDATPLNGDSFTGAATLAWRLSDALTVKSITGLATTRSTRFLDLDGTPFALLPVSEFTDSSQVSEELQAIFKTGPVDGVAGVYFSRETGEDNSWAAALSDLGTPPFVYDGVADNRSYALFAQANWHATSRLTVTGGLRYTWDDKGLVSYNHAGGAFENRLAIPTDPNPTLPGGAPNPDFGLSTNPQFECLIAPNLQNVAPGLCESDFVAHESALSWLASATYAITDDAMIYAKATRGYRAGGENLRGGALTFTPYGPEYATQYEGGLKSTFLGGRARADLAGFYTDYTSIQLNNIITVDVNGTEIAGTTVLNAGAAHLWGVEFEGTLIPINRLTLGITADWFHGAYTSYNYQAGAGAQVVNETTQPWQNPDYTVDLIARYDAPLPLGGLSFQADYFIQGRFPGSLGDITQCVVSGSACFYDRSQVIWIPERGLLDARVTLHIAAWKADISLWGKNLTNVHYLNGLLGGLDSRVFNIEYVGDPLTFGAEFRKAF